MPSQQRRLTAVSLAALLAASSGFSPVAMPTTSRSMHSMSSTNSRSNNNGGGTALFERKAGVASPEELKAFVEAAGSKLLVADVRNPDESVEPGDQKSLAVAALPSEGFRPQAQSLVYDRNTESMPLPDVDKDTPIITHCGGGGRGQKAKDYLMANGFTNVMNGGGPKETECWAEFGEK